MEKKNSKTSSKTSSKDEAILSHDARERIQEFQDFWDKRAERAEDIAEYVQQQRLLEINRADLEVKYPGQWVAYSQGELYVGAIRQELEKKIGGYREIEKMLTVPERQERINRDTFEQSAIPCPHPTPCLEICQVKYFRYRINVSEDITRGGYDIDEMYLPEFRLYVNLQAMFIAGRNRLRSIGKIYYGHTVMDRQLLAHLTSELNRLDQVRKQLAQEEAKLASEKSAVENLLVDQINARDKDSCQTCQHTYGDHRRLFNGECGSSYNSKNGTCPCKKFVDEIKDFF